MVEAIEDDSSRMLSLHPGHALRYMALSLVSLDLPPLLFNIWDAGSAKAVAASGAKAIATSSWSVANANGFSDGEQTSLTLAIENLRRIVGARDVPVTTDLETGYRDASEAVGEIIATAINAGGHRLQLRGQFSS